MKRAIIILWAVGLACPVRGQTGYPYSSTTQTTWNAFERQWSPVLTWYSGLVERAAIVGITNPPALVQSFTVATGITTAVTGPVTNVFDGVTNVYYFTNVSAIAYGSVVVTGLTPSAYGVTIDGVSGVSTAFPILTAVLITNLDTYHDALYPAFCPTSACWGGSYAYWMDAYTNLHGGVAWRTLGVDTPGNKAQTFEESGVGLVSGPETNDLGWITNGAALWSSPMRGFSGGDFRLASVNAELSYVATGFPTAAGIDFNGVYRWADSENYYDILGFGTPRMMPGAFWRDRVTPSVNIFTFDEIPNCSFYEAGGTNILLGSPSIADVGWAFSFALDDNSLLYGFGKPTGATNWFEWSSGLTTNPVPGSIARGLAWNYRAGGSWIKPAMPPQSIPTPADSWLVTNGAEVLRYSRQSTNYAAVDVTISGSAFAPGVGYYETSAVVSVSGPLTAVPVTFAGVTNMTASGAFTNGDSITLWMTNRELYTLNASTWGTINKRAMDERIAALKPLRWTVKTDFALTAIETNIWQGYNENSSASEAQAYSNAVASMAPGFTDYGATPALPDSEGHYGSAYIDTYYTGHKCEIVVLRKYFSYSITNLPTHIPHSVDVLMNVSTIPQNDIGYPQSFWSDIPGGGVQGLTFVYTNIPSSTNSGHTITLRPANTNAPAVDEYPTFDEATANGGRLIKGFQSPQLQAVIKWEPMF